VISNPEVDVADARVLPIGGESDERQISVRKGAMTATGPTDEGPNPFVTDIETATLANENYRTTLWTGRNLQMTVMSIEPGHDIGLEVHPDGDQFLRVEAGRAKVQMGPARDDLSFEREVAGDWVILVPAGSWHNVINIGDQPLKVYALYAPPEHPQGTVHPSKAEADADDHH
jgi:mannose-6-phosphate isomerase-like protein (cupin superfamily)